MFAVPEVLFAASPAVLGVLAVLLSAVLFLLLKVQEITERDQKKQTVINYLDGETRRLADMEIQAVNETARTDFYQNYLQAQARERELYLFLQQHFLDDLELAQQSGRSTLELAQQLLLRQKVYAVRLVQPSSTQPSAAQSMQEPTL